MSVFPRHILDLAAEVMTKARAAGVKIATAESCTGGLLAGALTDIPGSSDVFERGFVTYSNDSKIEMLGVPLRIIETYGAVSAEVAYAMAQGAMNHEHSQLAIAITGIAGPGGGSEAKPVGLVYLAVEDRHGNGRAIECKFGNIGRNEVRMKSVEAALNQLLLLL